MKENGILVIGFTVIYGIVLIMCIEDLRTKEVHTVFCISFLLSNLIMSFAVGKTFYQIFSGAIPGLSLFLCNQIFPQKIGGADIYFVLGSGFLLGPGNTLQLLLMSLLLVSLYGLMLAILKKGDKHKPIAMIPSLALFYSLASFYMLKEIL